MTGTPKIVSTLLVFSVLAVSLLAACGAAPPETAPLQAPAATPQPGLGAVSGQLPEAPQLWPDEPLMVYAVPFYPNQADPEEGFYVLDTSIHSMTELDGNGNFSINNVQPGSYVLVAGPRAEDSLLVVNPDQSPLIIQVMAGQVTTLEDLQLAK